VKKVLAEFGEQVWHHWPVLNGMGAPTLDCNGVCCGRAFYIETKAPGKFPTERQWLTINTIRKAGGKVFIIDGDTAELRSWLSAVCAKASD
jgi:hypothetical protein